MDPAEKRVLKRKRHLLCTHISLTPENQTRLTQYKLLTPAFYTLIEVEKTEAGKVGKLLDLLQDVPRAFGTLCEFISRLGPGHSWLRDELETECIWERGQIEVEPAVLHEALTVVHKEFGASKRLSVNEKNAIVELVSCRTQCARQVWANRLAAAHRDVETVEANQGKALSNLHYMLQQMTVFKNIHVRNRRDKKQIKEVAVEKSPDEVPESEQQVDSQSLLVAMQEEMAKIGDLVKSCNDHKDVLKQEHRDIARLINADKPVLGRLDEQLKETLLKLKRDLASFQVTGKTEEIQAKTLVKKLWMTTGMLGQSMSEKKDGLAEAERRLLQHQKELISLDEERESLQNELEDIEDAIFADQTEAHKLYTIRLHGYVSSSVG